MRVLEFLVDKQTLKKNGDFTGLIAGSSGYLKCHINFSKEWDNCLIAASFWIGDTETPVILNENYECCIPDEITASKRFSVSFSGVGLDGYTITTNKIKIYQGE